LNINMLQAPENIEARTLRSTIDMTPHPLFPFQSG
jgi:hypothetical protein